jgi:hypothetical protein
MLRLERIKRTDQRILPLMAVHYSQPKGFVGRNICYAVYYGNICYGAIVAGSATKFLPGRDQFFIKCGYLEWDLQNVINNIFYHVEPICKYPLRNFSSAVLKLFRYVSEEDWRKEYYDDIVGFETLIELPRIGELYRRDGWIEVGKTIGYSCKREGGNGTDSWTGKRVWNTTNLKPKLVLCREV